MTTLLCGTKKVGRRRLGHLLGMMCKRFCYQGKIALPGLGQASRPHAWTRYRPKKKKRQRRTHVKASTGRAIYSGSLRFVDLRFEESWTWDGAASREWTDGMASRSAKTSTCGIFVRCGKLLVVRGRPIWVAAQNCVTASLLGSGSGP